MSLRVKLVSPNTCSRKRAVIFFGWVFFLISSGSPHVRPMGVHRTCGEPDEIELTAMGVELNGSQVAAWHGGAGHVQRERDVHPRRERCRPRPRDVSPVSRQTPPQWGSTRFRPLICTYAPCGPSVRVDEPAKSRKIPTRKVLRLFLVSRATRRIGFRVATLTTGPRPEPFNSTPMAVNPISSGSPHVRPMGVHRTCGEPDEIKKNTHPKKITALFREQATTRTRPGWQRTPRPPPTATPSPPTPS